MADYIDRQAAIDAVQQAITEEYDRNYGVIDSDIVYGVLEEVSSADVVPVVHGEWEIVSNNQFVGYRCSICKRLNGFSANYCPHCGAKMDGGAHG